MEYSGIWWLVKTMEDVLQAEKKLDFIKHKPEGNKSFMAQHRQLYSKEIEYGEEVQGVLIIPEGFEGWDWEKFVVFLCIYFSSVVGEGQKNLFKRLERNLKNNNMGLKQNDQSATIAVMFICRSSKYGFCFCDSNC